MRYIGVEVDGSQPHVARLVGDMASLVAPLDAFWSDPWAAGDRHEAAEITVTALRQVPIVPRSARILCIGLNYRAHAAEGKFEVPAYPTIFGRWTPSLSVGDVPVSVPVDEDGLDWEGEIAVYVGTMLKNADEQEARAGIFGYSTFNDLTARRAQKLTAQWTLGKNVDASGPLGPLVTADEVGDLQDGLRVQTRVNGEVVQDGNSRDMIFSVESILSLVSRTMTLYPGDIIATGTPEGVGYVRNPPRLLNDGDVVEVDVEKLGVLRTPIGSVQ